MKRLLIGWVLMAGGLAASAQFGATTNEMLEQLAALQAYIKVAEKGYTIAEQGLQTIGQIKNGEFTLHSAFVSSLKGSVRQWAIWPKWRRSLDWKPR